MKNNLKISLLSVLTLLLLFAGSAQAQPLPGRWSAEKANNWYKQYPWLSGCDYIPANAINQIEMWSKDTYDHATIDKELGWAQHLGFKTMRVFLSSVVYANDAKGLKKRMDDFLTICDSHGIKPLFVFFDDCWNEASAYGKQPEPKTGIHNSGWVQDPSKALRADTAKLYPQLERYVKDILKTFGNDKRVLLWDLYNEPGNSKYDLSSLPLLRNVFKWAREVNPSQPLTAGIWCISDSYKPLNAFQLENSDVISYHNYSEPADHEAEVKYLLMLNRPLVCTEYMARTKGSYFMNVMPMLKKHNVVAINWGFVTGKTNTRYAWSDPHPDGSEPVQWFHDVLYPDGTPYSHDEESVIKNMNK